MKRQTFIIMRLPIDTGFGRAICGGGWFNITQSRDRRWGPEYFRDDIIGFRLILEVRR